MSTLYERIGGSYGTTRREDPRIAAAIHGALGDARSVVNVGAGTGSYEPSDREVLGVEPSPTMIAQRPPGSAPVIQASAEDLPLADASFDAAMAVNTLHHWTDQRAGLRELRRVARKRVVIFIRDGQSGTPFWLTEDYFPSLGSPRKRPACAEVSARVPSGLVAVIAEEFQSLRTLPVRLSHDCEDGLFSAYWARPERYLDAEIRRNISNFALAKADDVTRGLESLRADLASGAWDRKYGHLRSLPELDLGHRVLVAEL